MATVDIQNPYLQEFSNLPKDGQFLGREILVRKFSWAVPNDDILTKFAEFSPIIEIGAGKGYWAHMLSQCGAEVVAFDVNPPNGDDSNIYCDDGDMWYDVRVGDHMQLHHFPNHTPLLVWPEYDMPQALNFLESLGSRNTFLFVGESYGGCNGCIEFWNKISSEWSDEDYIQIPRYDGLHDWGHIFTRK
jgi:hypothetical protein